MISKHRNPSLKQPLKKSIEEEVENKNFEEDNQILILLSKEDVSDKRKIKDDFIYNLIKFTS